MNRRKRIQNFVTLTLLVFILGTNDALAQRRRNTQKTAPAQQAESQKKTNTSGSSTGSKSDPSTATLKETLDWLGSKLSDRAFVWGFIPGGDEQSFVPDDARPEYQVEGCTVSLRWVGKTKNAELSLPLSDIDPLTLRIASSVNVLTMDTTSPKRSIKYKYKEQRNPEGLTSSIKLDFNETDQANRVLRALQHAVKLCGGKVDPF